MTVNSLWPTQPCLAVMPDSRCAKDTSTATEHAPNARERAEVRPLVKMSLMVSDYQGNPGSVGNF